MTHTSTYTHTDHTLTNIHSQHGNDTHNVYARRGYAKQKQITHLLILHTQTQMRNCAPEKWLIGIFSQTLPSVFPLIVLHRFVLQRINLIRFVGYFLSFSASAKSAEMCVMKDYLEIIIFDRSQWINVWFVIMCLLYMHSVSGAWKLFSESSFLGEILRSSENTKKEISQQQN